MKELEKNLQYHFNNQHLLHQALTHTSKTGKLSENYERLEFLGDRVLGVAVAEMVYRVFPVEPEGSCRSVLWRSSARKRWRKWP